jgi:uncharacterized Zn ribbon protein
MTTADTMTPVLPATPETASGAAVRVQRLVSRRRKPIAREIIMARAAKASATKLAKRITKVCPACGKEWKEKPSHAWRKYCSNQCAGNALKNPNREKTCVRCGSKFKTTWKTRKRITCSTACAHAWHGQQQKERGHNPIKYRDKSKWLAAVQSEENRRAVSAGNLGKVRSTPKSKRYSPQHTRAVECFLRSPRNVVYYVRNITRFVHEKPELFPAETLNWKPSKRYKTSVSCAATHGLASVARGHRMTWRGWQVVSNREGRERYDLIGRNWQEVEPANEKGQR